MMKRQDTLPSPWVPRHLWQLRLSLTTFSTQEVISELDCRRDSSLTVVHTQLEKAHVGWNGHVYNHSYFFSYRFVLELSKLRHLFHIFLSFLKSKIWNSLSYWDGVYSMWGHGLCGSIPSPWLRCLRTRSSRLVKRTEKGSWQVRHSASHIWSHIAVTRTAQRTARCVGTWLTVLTWDSLVVLFFYLLAYL